MSFSPASDKMLKDLGMRFRKRAWPLGCRSSKSPRGPYQQTSIRDIEAGVAAARATTLVNITRVLDMEIDVGPGGEIVPAIKSMLQPDDDYLPACRRRRGAEEEEGARARPPSQQMASNRSISHWTTFQSAHSCAPRATTMGSTFGYFSRSPPRKL